MKQTRIHASYIILFLGKKAEGGGEGGGSGTNTNILKEVAIDSRLSPAKVRWRQPAVSSELSLVTAS